jgi:hypothetical protein
MRLCHRLRLFSALVLAGVLASQGCAKRAAAPGLLHPALTPAETNRQRLVARLLVPSLDRTSATVDQLRAQGALPFGAAELRGMLLARLSLPEDAVNLVDTSRPIALAFVAPASPAGEPRTMVAGALALRTPAGAGAFVDALGSLVGSDRDLLQLRRGDGEPIWVLRAGQALAWAATREALVEAGAHALDARTEAADDLVMTGYPAAWAQSQGADLTGGHQSLKARLIEQLDSDRERPRPVAERAALDAVLDFFLRPLPETELVDLRLGIGRERGAHIATRAIPRSGSAFAQRTAVRHPFSLEGAAAPAGSARLGGLAALGEDPAFLELLTSVVQAQARAGVPGAAPTAERLRPLLGRLSGGVVALLRPSGSELGADLALPTRAGTTPAAVLEDLSALLSDPGLTALLRHLYRIEGPVRVSRENDRLRAEIGSDLTVLATAAQGHLLLATDPGASERLSLAASRGGPGASPPASPPALPGALAEARGREGLLFADVLALIGPLMSAVGGRSQARMVQGLLSLPGVAGRQLPLWISFAGGAHLEVDLRIPIDSLTTAAGFLGFFGRDG